MNEITLVVEERDGTGKSVTRKLRMNGRVPAVVYGHGKESLNLSFDPATLERLLHDSDAGLNTLIGLKGVGAVSGRTVLVKELQRDPVRGNVIHADLFEIDLTERIVVSVPVHVSGTAEGVTAGGLLDHSLREVELECLPNAIPDAIDLDVSTLNLGDSVHARELQLGDGVELRTQGDLAVVSVVMPTVVEEEPALADEGEEGAEVDGEAAEGAGGEGASDKSGQEADKASGSKES